MSSKLEDETIKLLIEEYNNSDPELLFEMSTISTQESGLKTKLNVMQNNEDRRYKHWCRVKVVLPSNKVLFPILVNDKEIKPLNKNGEYSNLSSNDKQIVNDAIKYIKNNLDLILHYWNGDFEEFELHDILAGRNTLENILSKKGK